MPDTITHEELHLVCEEQAKTMTTWEIIEVGWEFSERGIYGVTREQLPNLREGMNAFLAARQSRLDNCITELRGKIHSPGALETLDILAQALVQRFGSKNVRRHLTWLAERI